MMDYIENMIQHIVTIVTSYIIPLNKMASHTTVAGSDRRYLQTPFADRVFFFIIIV